MRKHLLLALAICYTIFIIIVSVINLKNVPNLGSSFDDKIFHFGAYVVFGFLWGNYFIRTKIENALSISFVLTLIFGIVIEIFQETLNPLRTYDTYDLLSNCLGVAVGTMIVWGLTKTKVKIK